MSYKAWTWISSLAALAVLGSVAAAAPPERPGPWHRGPGPHMARMLGLSDQQTTAFEALHREQREAMQPLLDQQHKLGETLHAALEAQDPDPADVGRKAIALHAGMQALKAAHAAFKERVVALLDTGQKEKFKLLEESGVLPGHGPGHGPGGPLEMMGHRPPPEPPEPAQ